jgi:hypothetical protein
MKFFLCPWSIYVPREYFFKLSTCIILCN